MNNSSRCPDCHSGFWWMKNGPSGAQETCRHPWHERNKPRTGIYQTNAHDLLPTAEGIVTGVAVERLFREDAEEKRAALQEGGVT